MSIPSFKQYLVEEQKEVFFTFGRMNPPTIGHGKLLNVLSTKAGKNPYKVYLSQSSDSKKNPLTYEQKIKHVRKMFPKHARNVILNKKLRNVFEIATFLYDQGYNKITMVVGADRITEFKTLLEKYNGKEARHGFYNFEKISIVSAGERDPDAEGVEGMSASKQRENAKNNDFATFSQGLPNAMSNKDAKRLFNDVRSGMGLKEMTQFKNHIELEPVSKTREKFVEGKLFNEGDNVIIKKTGETGSIHRLGTNYVIVALEEGRISRQWIDDIELDESGFGGGGILRDIAPALDRFLDKTINRKQYQRAIRMFLDLRKKNPNDARRNLIKAAQITNTDVRTLDKLFRSLAKAGKMPKHLLNYEPTFVEDVSKEKINAQPKMHTDRWYKDQPEWGTPEATKKAKKMVPGQESAYVKEDVSQAQIKDLEKFADRLLAKFDIDVEFTKHFADRMNDSRNKPAISIPEMQRLFKKIAREKGVNIKKNANAEVVLNDIQTDLNLPVVIKYNKRDDEFEVVNKTIMRKRDFKTSNRIVRYEQSEISEDEIDNAKMRIRLDKEQEREATKRERDRKEREYDRILDRARLARARRKNKQT